jgi:hypothetical protein
MTPAVTGTVDDEDADCGAGKSAMAKFSTERSAPHVGARAAKMGPRVAAVNTRWTSGGPARREAVRRVRGNAPLPA